MEDSTGQVVRRAAEVYEEFFVPALFAEWSPRVTEAIAPERGQKILDIACGTGVLARELARRVGTANVVGLDCNEEMLAVAQERRPEIRWRAGTAEDLPFESGAFDAVVCQFGLMFFSDKVKALRQMWRVLKPGGSLAVVVWGPLSESPGYSAMVALLTKLFGEDVANELRAPFNLGDKETLSTLIEDSGIHTASISTTIGEARFPSIAEWVRTDVRGWTLADKLDDQQFALLSREAEDALGQFTNAEGAVRFASPAHIAVATKAV
jgi:ubiquinone/menaquinone biosynthesis C-methylase UbiE